MIPEVDATHDQALASFVSSAQDAATDFPIQNLPLGVFRRSPDEPARIGCAIGNLVLDLAEARTRGLLEGLPSQVLEATTAPLLNLLMACPPHERRALRHRLSHLLRAEGGQVSARPHAPAVLVPQADVELLLPAAIGDYTDFYASIFHATNVGRMLRPDSPLLPNYKHVPIGYHGRASSHRGERHAGAASRGQTEPASARRRRRSGRPGASTTSWRWGFRGRGQCARRAGPARPGRGASVRARASSTTGRRATCRSGSTSRSGRSSPRASRPRLSPWVVTPRGARALPRPRVRAARPAIPRPCPTSTQRGRYPERRLRRPARGRCSARAPMRESGRAAVRS